MDQRPPPPVREDCWSEGETAALVAAWGDRYELGRGILRQKDWLEVADAVNSRPGAAASSRPPRTDAQCKNRVDTIKKKYKNERARLSLSGAGATSQWPFFARLDALLSAAPSPAPPLLLPPHRPAAPLPVAAAPPAPRPVDRRIALVDSAPPRTAERRLTISDSVFQKAAAAAAAAAAEEMDESDSESDSMSRSSPPPPLPLPPAAAMVMPLRANKRKRSGEEGIRALAQAIERYAEIYEQAEQERLRTEMEMQQRRMEFEKELERQRMQMLAETQARIEKLYKNNNNNKRTKRVDAGYY